VQHRPSSPPLLRRRERFPSPTSDNCLFVAFPSAPSAYCRDSPSKACSPLAGRSRLPGTSFPRRSDDSPRLRSFLLPPSQCISSPGNEITFLYSSVSLAPTFAESSPPFLPSSQIAGWSLDRLINQFSRFFLFRLFLARLISSMFFYR